MELNKKPVPHLLSLLTILPLILLTACGEGANEQDNAPIISDITLTDDTGGSAIVGDTLTATYRYTDPENDAEGTSSYRWLRNGTAIADATGISYTLVAADMGQDISFEITPIAATGTTRTGITVTVNIAVDNAPVASNVRVTDENGGIAQVGDLLIGSYEYSDAENDTEATSTIQWLRNGAPINGATQLIYTLTREDTDNSVTFEVTPMAITGTSQGVPFTSNGITVLNTAPTLTGVTIIAGNVIVVGDELTAAYTYADAENDEEGDSTYRWRRNGSIIPGATARTYALTRADSGQTITLEITPVAQTGTTTGTRVGATESITVNNVPTATATVTGIDGAPFGFGDPLVDRLTGDYIYADAENDEEGNTAFQWLRNGETIVGETGLTYDPTLIDNGQRIAFSVTPIARTGSTRGDATASTALIIGIPPIVSDIVIIDDNGKSARSTDQLTVDYIYTDAEGDQEGTSTYRWLRDGNAIEGATEENYTLAPADVFAQITVEVTPVARTGARIGAAAISATSISVVNTIPLAADVSIIDENGEFAVVGDTLIGSYTFVDNDDDAEGASVYRWFRNDVLIDDATANRYTLLPEDVATNITFAVTPVSTVGELTGELTGETKTSPALATGTPPIMIGFARYLDINNNSIIDENDQLVIPFDQDIVVTELGPSYFRLVVNGDSFGTGASVSAGPASNEMTIVLGSMPRFTLRGDFSLSEIANGSPSGIRFVGGGERVLSLSGIRPVFSLTPIDLTAGFVESSQPEGELSARSGIIALGDLDGDTDLDVVVTLSNSNRIYWNQDGVFDPAENEELSGSGSSTGESIVLGDVDNDGDLDIIVIYAGIFGQMDLLYINNGAEGFDTRELGAADNRSKSVALGDLNGDGALDIVITNNESGRPSELFLNTSDNLGVFTDSGQALAPILHSDNSVSLADVDGDSDLDIIIGNRFGNKNVIYLNNEESGSFIADTRALGELSSDFRYLTLGDVDGDGDLDLIVANGNRTTNRIYFNDSAGNFIDSDQSLGASNIGTYFMALSDLDDDGDLDIVAANRESVQVYVNDGDGYFTDFGQIIMLTFTESVAIGDVDGDGDQDFVVPERGLSLPFKVYLNSLPATE